jgi:Na+-translocating ferredoxin:NAD+ oxidoreductase subunit E
MPIATETLKDLAREGLWSRNPALVGLLGLCPLLAVSTNLINGIVMGCVSTMVLTLSAGLISLLKERIAAEVRLPLFMLILASTVTLADLAMEALIPDLHDIIGLFIPLIVTNCVILGRIEAFAYRQPIPLAMMDSLLMGAGFTWVIALLGALREILGNGTLLTQADRVFGEMAKAWEIHIMDHYPGFLVALQPAGAFILLGLILALRNAINARRSARTAPKEYEMVRER